jgi:hypothetical protein
MGAQFKYTRSIVRVNPNAPSFKGSPEVMLAAVCDSTGSRRFRPTKEEEKSLRPPGLVERTPKPQNKIKSQYHVPAEHHWRRPWKRTFLSCENPDISTLRWHEVGLFTWERSTAWDMESV